MTGVNDAPVAVDDTGTTDEDTNLSVAAPGVLGNDTDVEVETAHGRRGQRCGRPTSGTEITLGLRRARSR